MKASKFELLSTKGRETVYDSHDGPEDSLNDENEELVERAVAYFQGHIFSFFVCMLSGLLGLMYLPGAIKVLSITDKSDNPLRAFLRYLSTINHTLAWYSRGKKERIESWKKVRKLHAAANAKSLKVNGPNGFMTQFDMVTTQWAFVGPAIILPEKLGFGTPSDESLDAVRHLMYLIGKNLGVRDEFNLCSGNLEECKEYCHEILVNVFRPAMVDVSSPPEMMAEHLLEGMHLFNPIIDPEGFKHCTRTLFGSIAYEAKIAFSSSYSKFMFHFQYFFFNKMMTIDILRVLMLTPMVNGLMRLNIFISNKLKNYVIWKNSQFKL